MPRWACSTSARRSRTIAHGGEQPRDRRRDGAGGEQRRPSRRARRAPRLAPRPERHRLPAHQRRARRRPARSGRRGWRRARPTCPAAAACRPRRARSRPGRVLAPALHGEDARSPLSVIMPGKTRLAGELRARRDHDLGDARAPRHQRVRGVVELVLLDQRARVAAEVAARSSAGARSGSSRSPKSTTIAIMPSDSGRPTSANSKNPKCPTPASSRRLGDDHVDRRPGQRQQRAGVRAERQRQQQLRRRAPGRTAITTATGTSAATAPLTLISAVSTRDQHHRVARSAASGSPRRGRPAPARPTPSRPRRPAPR